MLVSTPQRSMLRPQLISYTRLLHVLFRHFQHTFVDTTFPGLILRSTTTRRNTVYARRRQCKKPPNPPLLLPQAETESKLLDGHSAVAASSRTQARTCATLSIQHLVLCTNLVLRRPVRGLTGPIVNHRPWKPMR
jgi:hypothetical protein